MQSRRRATAPRLNPLALCLLGSGTLLAFAPAWAQSQAAAPQTQAMETVVVTGFRASLESALNKKREDRGIVDVIKAEDIGKFPDTNLAESLQRVPGVVIDRDAGEGRSITVRGLGADFTRVRINGLEALATTGGTDSSGGANRSRGFDFNVFASELFSSITVRKSASADVDEGSLGATVDLQTGRPFDFKRGWTATASAQGRYNDLSGKTTPRVAGLVSFTDESRRFGALMSVAYSERKVLEEGFSTVRWANGVSSQGLFATAGSDPAALAASNNAANFHPRLPRYGRLTHDQSRLGITSSLQFRPGENTLVSADLMYAKLEATRQEDFLQAISFSRTGTNGKPQTSVLQAVYDASGELVRGVYNGVDIRSESRFDELSTEFVQPTLSLEHDFSDTLRMSVKLGQGKSRFRNPVQTTTTLDANNVNGYSIDFSGNSRLPLISYPISVTELSAGGLGFVTAAAGAATVPATLVSSEIRIRPLGATNRNDNGQVDLSWDLVPDRYTLKAGLSYKRFVFDTFESRRTNEALMYAPPSGVAASSLTTTLTGFGKGLNLPAGVPTSWIIPNLGAIAAAYDIYCNCLKSGPAGGPGDFRLTSISNGSARGNNFGATEKDEGAYVMLDFSERVSSLPLRGNVGVRYVRTSQTASGFDSVGNGTPTQETQSYTDVLPSLNVALNLSRELILRAAAAKVMARPRLNDLNPGMSLNTANQTITAGNPNLKPYRAKTLDFNGEWYFSKEGFLGVGLFYKDIDTYIQSLRGSTRYGDTGLPLSSLPNSQNADTVYAITTPINTEGGSLKGIELNWQQPFKFLPGVLSNTGMQFNYTYVKSNVAYRDSAAGNASIVDNLIGLSPRSANVSVYYDDGRFSARLSTSYRSAFLTRVPGQNNNDVEGTNAAVNVDMSLSYDWDDRLTFTFEGTNLNNRAKDQFVSRSRNSPVVYNVTGREFLFGARYKF
ncbi:TonB-dependent receptor [Roseateles sp.]|jgi:iron complex outermembrane receptor protein|uniref:TonB-dependent receptor n=1 Tax=Roseateles sp. TaxID=1971397 RepID=UPI00391C2D1C